MRESLEAAEARWKRLELLQQHYGLFNDFLQDVMDFLGFNVTDIQADIGEYLQFGPKHLMVQAQRGEAKTTITAAYAVWDLVHYPKHRVKIASAGEKQATEISTLIVKLIGGMPELECLRPDPRAGDRTSVEAFDVHHSLKGVDKSPSISSFPIKGNFTGGRADLLIADDIEVPSNSRTAAARLQVIERSKEFSDLIMGDGRILWLGTPQSGESIYNHLPSRGVAVRIWPGRYPTQDQLSNYGNLLAPLILERIKADPSLQTGGGLLGDQGQPTDPQLRDEEALTEKELDKGTAAFQLQYMLNTRISDAMRFPLKEENLVVMNLQRDRLPVHVVRSFDSRDAVPYSVHGHGFSMTRPVEVSDDSQEPEGVAMYIDPAGGGANADETGYAVTAALNGNVFLLDVGGIPGGYSPEAMQALAVVAAKWRVDLVMIEKNFGYGAFREVFSPILQKIHKCSIQDDYVTGQKELRIIGTLEPVLGRGGLIVNSLCIESETASLERYEASKRLLYSFFFQLGKVTRDRGSLVHDDRLDAVEGAVRYWVRVLQIDQDVAVKEARESELMKFYRDPFGHTRYDKRPGFESAGGNTLDRYFKR